MEELQRRKLIEKANLLRKHALSMVYEAQSGHPGGSLSLADIMAYLYFYRLRYDVSQPKMQDRDRLILSKGHAAPILYAALGEAGFFSKDAFHSLRKLGSLLQGHPCIHTPGVDASSGSLGLGVSFGVGMALTAKRTGNPARIHVITGDGEQDEGQIWEAAMAAAKFQLGQLTVILDRNRFQNDGATEDVMPLDSLADKWRAFRWNVVEINGHNFDEIDEAFTQADNTKNKPTLILANTVKGCGASYLLNKPELHYTPPTKEQYEMAMAELDEYLQKNA